MELLLLFVSGLLRGRALSVQYSIDGQAGLADALGDELVGGVLGQRRLPENDALALVVPAVHLRPPVRDELRLRLMIVYFKIVRIILLE